MGTNTELESKVGLSAAALASLLYSHYGQPHSMEVSAHIVKSMGWMCRDDMLLEKLKKDPLVPGDIPSPCPTEAQGLQGRSIHGISVQPVPVPHHPPCRRFCPCGQPKSPLLELETTLTHSSVFEQEIRAGMHT